MQIHVGNSCVCPIPWEVRNYSSVEKGLYWAEESARCSFPLFVPESAKVCLIERYVLEARGELSNSKSHFLQESLPTPEIR